MSEKNNVNPSHYTETKVAPIDLIKAYDLNFNLGNVVKYTARAKKKNGREDLCKALWYLLDDLGFKREFISHLTDQAAKGEDHISDFEFIPRKANV